jgi:hypothetical protein
MAIHSLVYAFLSVHLYLTGTLYQTLVCYLPVVRQVTSQTIALTCVYQCVQHYSTHSVHRLVKDALKVLPFRNIACPAGTYADNTTRLCAPSCNVTAMLYKDASTWTCVTSCPSTPNLYANNQTMSCDAACTNGYYAYDIIRKCVPSNYFKLYSVSCNSSLFRRSKYHAMCSHLS